MSWLWRFLPAKSRWRWRMAQSAELDWWAEHLRSERWREYATDGADFLKHRQGGLGRRLQEWPVDLRPYLNPERMILDVGCGPYSLLGLPRVIGVDPLVRGYGKLVDLRADTKTVYVESKGEDLPFADNYFDTVWSRNVIDHVHRPAQLLAEAIRVLRPGGVFVLVFDKLSEGGVHHPHGGVTPGWVAAQARTLSFTVEGVHDIREEHLMVLEKVNADVAFRPVGRDRSALGGPSLDGVRDRPGSTSSPQTTSHGSSGADER